MPATNDTLERVLCARECVTFFFSAGYWLSKTSNKVSLQNWWKYTHLHEHVLASKAGSYKVCNLSFAS